MAGGPSKREEATQRGSSELTALSRSCWGKADQARSEIFAVRACRAWAIEKPSPQSLGIKLIRMDRVRESVFFVVRYNGWLMRVHILAGAAMVLRSDKVTRR